MNGHHHILFTSIFFFTFLVSSLPLQFGLFTNTFTFKILWKKYQYMLTAKTTKIQENKPVGLFWRRSEMCTLNCLSVVVPSYSCVIYIALTYQVAPIQQNHTVLVLAKYLEFQKLPLCCWDACIWNDISKVTLKFFSSNWFTLGIKTLFFTFWKDGISI